MKTLGEIKQLMASGATAKADASLKELLAAEPENLQAKMLYGACRQLLGDEETFKRIHDELAPEMENLPAEIPESRMWARYKVIFYDIENDALCMRMLNNDDGAAKMEYVIIAMLILVALLCGIWLFGKNLQEQFRTAYAGPEYFENHKLTNTIDAVGIENVPGKFAD